MKMPAITRDPYRLDANESAFFARELEVVKANTYDTKLKQLKGLSVVPAGLDVNNGATEITWRQFTNIGYAKLISDYAKDLPRVDVFGTEQTVKVKGIGAAYGYSIKEIRSSQFAGKKLDQRRALSARRAIEEKLNAIAISGDTASGLGGLINRTDITSYTVLADGTGSSALWANKTPDQIVRDVTGIVNAVMVPTNGVEAPDTLLLPLAKYNYIANTRMGTTSDITILGYILKNSPSLKRIEWMVELTGAGVGGTDRMIVGSFDADHLTLEIPQPFEQFAPLQRGLSWEVPCHAETAGVIVYYPLAFAQGDGI
jgi:hypothetical protein